MKKILILALLMSSPAFAWDDEYEVDGNQVYESSQGNRYEYDLNNPADQIRYEMDVEAQMRDEQNSYTNPTNELYQELERGIGEYGAGIYD